MRTPVDREDPASASVTISSRVGVAPYRPTQIGWRGGLKHTSFYPVTGRLAKDWKLHNTYLKPNRFTDPIEEYWALRRVAGLWDVTGEEVVEVTGPDALQVMDELVPRDLGSLEDGRCLYGIMCYDDGGIVEDGILVRFSAERLWWVGGPGPAEQWIRAHAPGRRVAVRSWLDHVHVASLQGPESRSMLAEVAEAEIAAVPYFGMVETRVCGTPVVITRTGYTAELGYDIYVAVDRGAELFAQLWRHVQARGALLCGSRAMDIRRTEASILNIGQEFDWRVTPLEIGLDRLVAFAKPSFRGREALLRQREEGVGRRLVGLRLDGGRVAFAGETVLVGDRPAGQVTTGNWSPALEASLAMAMVRAAAAAPGMRVAVEMDGWPEPGVVTPMPFLDPERRIARA